MHHLASVRSLGSWLFPKVSEKGSVQGSEGGNDALGCASKTALIAFTVGCSGMRSIPAGAGATSPPLLDWLHLSSHLQHAKQMANALPASAPAQEQAKAGINTEVERLRREPGTARPRDARITFMRIRALLPAFKGRPA